jgi:hypothetical protein|tara:strand:+ start:845 stop:1000 length:156 start_codon:yes stop_codon:yes gene_type:complete
MSPEQSEQLEKDALIHKLQHDIESIKELVRKYPNNMQLGKYIRRFVIDGGI